MRSAACQDPVRTPSSAWTPGDYPAMAERLGDVARLAVVRSGAGVRARVLDVACGTGNVALLAARVGAEATGIDSIPELVATARRRAENAGYDLDWVEGDVHRLPFEDGAFDAVISMFGIAYAADAARAVSEAVRVLAYRGRLVLTVWAGDSFVLRADRVVGRYLSAAHVPAFSWDDAHAVRRLFADHGLAFSSERRVATLSFADLEAATSYWLRAAPHVQAARRRLEREQQWEELRAELRAAVAGASVSSDGVTIPLEYDLLSAALIDPRRRSA